MLEFHPHSRLACALKAEINKSINTINAMFVIGVSAVALATRLMTRALGIRNYGGKNSVQIHENVILQKIA